MCFCHWTVSSKVFANDQNSFRNFITSMSVSSSVVSYHTIWPGRLIIHLSHWGNLTWIPELSWQVFLSFRTAALVVLWTRMLPPPTNPTRFVIYNNPTIFHLMLYDFSNYLIFWTIRRTMILDSKFRRKKFDLHLKLKHKWQCSMKFLLVIESPKIFIATTHA
jgi:hypothetical protein